MEAVVILLVIIAVLAVAGVLIYNGLVARRNRVFDHAATTITTRLRLHLCSEPHPRLVADC